MKQEFPLQRFFSFGKDVYACTARSIFVFPHKATNQTLSPSSFSSHTLHPSHPSLTTLPEQTPFCLKHLIAMLRSTLLFAAVAAVSAQRCWENDDCAPSEWCRPLEWYGHCFQFYSVCVPKRAEGETCGGSRPCRVQHCQDHLSCESHGSHSSPLCVQPPKRDNCTLQCGTVVADGWIGADEGTNDCNTCTCFDGSLACTKAGCPDSKACPNTPEPTTCTLACGTVVPVGWGGKDEGSNACNSCGCLESGHLRCTQIACPNVPCVTKKSCELQCGTVVADGWNGKDEGTNDCNTCTCNDGSLGCTKIGCPATHTCPKPEPTTCTLACGTVVPVGWGGKDEGSNACNSCGCLESGHLRCTQIACPNVPCVTKKSCELQCGTVVADGWNGKDEGTNDCNTCTCFDGSLACTKAGCPDSKACPNTPEPTTCTLACGTVVPVGWGGKDEGSNACNSCGCLESGLLRCTMMACPKVPCVTKKSCELRCGTVVADGWTGNDEGSNDCNTCTCNDGSLGCTKIGCPATHTCPKPEPTTCTLACGTVVPVGWGGKDEGSNACNSCGCLESGLLRCTQIACPNVPCVTKKSCELQCGTVVADGWNGKDEGTNDCNTCTCFDGSLACTKAGCPDSKACPNTPEPTTCTLACGTVVPVGWGGKDEGSNACNSCGCLESGHLRCTQIACPNVPCVTKKSCELQCGTVVADGWNGKDEGTNDCNTCTCFDGSLACTKAGCPDSKACPNTPEPTTCTLACGTVVPVGWGGKDEGSNACNSCGCLESGLLRCTMMACPKVPCVTKKSCELRCGTVVADGWTGNDEGSNDCNTCTCNDGSLGCTKIGCPATHPCL